MANHLAMAALFEPGDEILVEHPTYELLLSTASYLGAEIRRFERRVENGFRIDPDEVAAATTPRTRLIVLTNLNNPSSVQTDEPALKTIGAAADRVGANVLVDEVYLDCAKTPAGTAPSSAFHLGPNFVTTSSLTKVYGLSGIRCGWILARPELAEKMWRLNDLFAATPAHPAELLSVIALDHLAEIAAYSEKQLARNRSLLNEFLDSAGRARNGSDAGGNDVVSRSSAEAASTSCTRSCESRYETSVVPGRFFEMPEHFRIGIGGETEMLEEGLARIGRALDDLKSSG